MTDGSPDGELMRDSPGWLTCMASHVAAERAIALGYVAGDCTTEVG
jgi:hypothetical protein